MPGNPRGVITAAERRFPVRVRIGVPSGGLGQRLTQVTAWRDGTPARTVGNHIVRNGRHAA
jgi:hypothetical protein